MSMTEIHSYGDDMEILHKSENEGNRNIMGFDCPQPLTPYAPPQQRWLILEGTEFDVDCDVLTKFFLEKEQWVIDTYAPDTDVAPQAPPLTQRLSQYNIFEWESECVELFKLRKIIKKFHKEYNKVVFGKDYRFKEKLWIRCWMNIMREGEVIGNHIHSTSPISYLAGHMTISCDDSQTIYSHPLFQLPDGHKFYSDNKAGTLTLFPATVPHCTTVQKTNTPRVTIAFDLAIKDDPGAVLLPL